MVHFIPPGAPKKTAPQPNLKSSGHFTPRVSYQEMWKCQLRAGAAHLDVVLCNLYAR